MANTTLIKFGTTPTGTQGSQKTGWVAFANNNPRRDQSGDLVLGPLCYSLSEIENVVDQLRDELDEILNAAQAHFGIHP